MQVYNQYSVLNLFPILLFFLADQKFLAAEYMIYGEVGDEFICGTIDG